MSLLISSLELDKAEFFLGSVINAVVSQVMILLRERNLQLIRDIPEEIKTLAVYGDQARLQQVLADFLLNMVHYAPSTEGWVEIHVRPILKQISDGLIIVHIEFRCVSLNFRPSQLFVAILKKQEENDMSKNINPFFHFAIFLFMVYHFSWPPRYTY